MSYSAFQAQDPVEEKCAHLVERLTTYFSFSSSCFDSSSWPCAASSSGESLVNAVSMRKICTRRSWQKFQKANLKTSKMFTVILQIFSVVLSLIFSVVNDFTEIKKTHECEKCIQWFRHCGMHGHRNLNETELIPKLTHAPKICKLAVFVLHLSPCVTLALILYEPTSWTFYCSLQIPNYLPRRAHPVIKWPLNVWLGVGDSYVGILLQKIVR